MSAELTSLPETREEGMYLTFRLGEETYGFDILRVREIVKMLDITRVPQTHAFLKGLVNLRGKVVPVIDLRLRFGMSAIQATEETCIIVIEMAEDLIGVVVDSVSEVLAIDEGNIAPPPEYGAKCETGFLKGMGKVGERIVILLDINVILDITDFSLNG